MRLLGLTEEIYYNTGFFGHNIVVPVTFTGELRLDILQKALSLIQEKYPSLNYCIKEKPLRFEKKKFALIPCELREQQTFDKVKTVEEELCRPFNTSEGPLIRTIYIPASHQKNDVNYLIITVHHIISDGLSSVHLVENLFNIIDSLINNPTAELFPAYPERSSVEMLLPTGYKADAMGNTSCDNLEESKVKELSNLKTGIIPLVFPSEILNNLTAASRSAGVTIQAILLAICSMGLTKIVLSKKEYSDDVNNAIVAFSLVNLRPFLDETVTNKELHLCISTLMTKHSVKENSDIWELIQDAAAQLESAKSDDSKYYTNQLIFMKALLSKCKNPIQLMNEIKSEAPSFVVSNLGANIPVKLNYENAKLCIKEFTFFVSVHAFDQNKDKFTLTTATINETMTINLHYPACFMTKDKAIELSSFIQAEIKKIANYQLESRNRFSIDYEKEKKKNIYESMVSGQSRAHPRKLPSENVSTEVIEMDDSLGEVKTGPRLG